MGSLCSKEETQGGPSNRPVRTLGTTPTAGRTTASVPAKKPAKVGGPPRTLGGTPAGGAGGAGAGSTAGDARMKAALAAERRAAPKKPAGALGQKLAEQRKMTHTETLKQMSEEERRRRDGDSQADLLSYH